MFFSQPVWTISWQVPRHTSHEENWGSPIWFVMLWNREVYRRKYQSGGIEKKKVYTDHPEWHLHVCIYTQSSRKLHISYKTGVLAEFQNWSHLYYWRTWKCMSPLTNGNQMICSAVVCSVTETTQNDYLYYTTATTIYVTGCRSGSKATDNPFTENRNTMKRQKESDYFVFSSKHSSIVFLSPFSINIHSCLSTYRQFNIHLISVQTQILQFASS